MEETGRPRIPPYVAYKTFRNFLDEISARGLPSRIDRSVMPHRAGAIQSQLLLTLGYLGLIHPTGRPTAKLTALAGSEGKERRRLLASILLEAYPFLRDKRIDLSSATSTEMEAIFGETGASGETVRRSIAFLLSAARDAGLKVSSYIQPHRGKRRTPVRTESPDGGLPERPERTSLPPGEIFEIELRSGGTLTLSLSAKLFELTREDREFLSELIDHLQSYRKKPAGGSPESA